MKDDLRSEGARQFHAHVSEAAESNNADLLARADTRAFERRVGRDSDPRQMNYDEVDAFPRPVIGSGSHRAQRRRVMRLSPD